MSSPERTVMPNPQVFSAVSAADERTKPWTLKNQWRRRFFRSAVKDVEYATKKINHVAGELAVRISSLIPYARHNVLQFFKQIHGGERQSIRRSRVSNDPNEDRFSDEHPLTISRRTSRSRYASRSRPQSWSRPPSVDFSISADRSLYKGRETARRSRVGSSHRKRSIVSEGHTSPDEDGESRKRIGPASPRPRPPQTPTERKKSGMFPLLQSPFICGLPENHSEEFH